MPSPRCTAFLTDHHALKLVPFVGSTASAGVGEPSPAARALAVAPSQERRERTRLRQGHDRPERQRGAVGVVAVRDPADRVAEDLDRRLGDVLVVVRRARLPQVLQLPGLLLAGLDVQPRLDAGEVAQRLEASVRARPAAEEDGGVGARVLRHDALEVGVHDAVHRPVERLAGLHPAVEQPPPGRPLLDLAVRRLPIPDHVPPEDRLVGRRRLPDGPGVDAVVEEHDQGGAPVPADRERGVPAPRPFHLVGREVEGVDLGLGQVVSAGDVALVPGRGEPRRRVDQLLLPGPGEDGAEVLAGLVRRAARVRPLVRDGPLVDPVEELADVLAPQLLDGDAAAPLLPLPEGREVLVARPAGQGLGAQVALGCRLEGRRHLIGPGAADPCPAARPVRGDHPRTC